MWSCGVKDGYDHVMTAEFVGVGRVSGSASKVSSLELLICLAGAQRAVTQFIFTAFAVFQMNSLALALFVRKIYERWAAL